MKEIIEQLLKDKDIINEINYNAIHKNETAERNNMYLSGKLIGEVFRYCIIHQNQKIDQEEVKRYIQDIKAVYYSSYLLDEKLQSQFIESNRSGVIAKSIAEKLNIDHSSKEISPKDQERIKEYFINNYVKNGYVFHSFPSQRKQTIQEVGFTQVEKLWDNEKVEEVVKIFEEQGVIKALGGYGFYDGEAKEKGTTAPNDEEQNKRKIYVEHNPEEIFFHTLSSPEWLKFFTSSSHTISDKSLESSPFFVKNYEACKQNVKDLCKNAGLTREQKEKVSSLFKECWKTLGKPELTTALIPKAKVGKDHVPKEIENLNILETISYILTDSTRDFVEHVGNVVDVDKIKGKDLEIVEMSSAETFIHCDSFKRETQEELYDPEKNVYAIYYGIVSSDGTKTLTQEQYNKVFNKMEKVFATNPDKYKEISKNLDKLKKSIRASSLKDKEKIVDNFDSWEEKRNLINSQEQESPQE